MLDLSPQALSVLDKVRKLLALANNNANEHEAAIASAKAMELLAQHNLDMAVVGESRTASNRQDNKTKGGLYTWQRQLWNAVAELNFCKYWYIAGTGKGQTYMHRILGRRENVVAAEILAEYLQSAVERLAQEWAKRQGMNVFKKEAIIYREGIALRLVSRLNDQRREKLSEERRKEAARKAAADAAHSPSGGTALVLASVIQSEDDLNNDYLQGWEPGTTARKRAESDARSAAWAAEWRVKREAAERARDEAELANPALKEARLAKEAEAQRLLDEQNAKWDREWERKKAKREAYYQQHGRYPEDNKKKRLTKEELRRTTPAFQAGYVKGADIGLDKQIDEQQRKGIV